ncbi:uncharacterized protein LDX57_009965 [Aspergillus melleus]|uniref:uncharacterized protein n=1 Tax=Aspergillus melleus TaxID=138277 RepID=UPI001E8DEDB7|nr:uncharacterized protein LDX57_009965 [Aspergillus melleus]KAH8432326.1 hypothetical protein LDX57_009965 [Aspergillus melleus]
MSSPTKLLSSPTKALNPLSPERINQQQLPPQSPSQSSDIFDLHRKSARANSDVQSKVAFLNQLSRTGSPAGPQQPSASASAALQRAILGREEAESALSNVFAQLSEAQSRERRISERLESLLEELQASKERKAHERTIYEKEIRKARKEAFRAGSTLVKTQEDLKEARGEAKAYKEELEVERKSKDKAKQEAFERAYAIAGLTEELEELKARLRVAEAKNAADPLKTRDRALRKEVGSRVSLAEGDLALLATPASRRPKRSADYLADFPIEEMEESPTKATPPKRLRLSDVAAEDREQTPRQAIKEEIEEAPQEAQEAQEAHQEAPHEGPHEAPPTDVKEIPEEVPENALIEAPKEASLEVAKQAVMRPTKEDFKLALKAARREDRMAIMRNQAMVEHLQISLRLEKRMRENAEELAEFLRMECEFKRCSCRVVEELESVQVQSQPQIKDISPEIDVDASKQNKQALNQQTHAELLDQPVSNHLPAEQHVPKAGSPTSSGIRDKTPPPPKHAPMDSNEASDEPLITFSPITGTFQKIPSPVRSGKKHAFIPPMSPVEAAKRQPTSPLAKYELNQEEEPAEYFQAESAVPAPVHLSPTPAQTTPVNPPLRTAASHRSTTNDESMKRVPLRKEGSIPGQSTAVQGTPISREEALAQIRARRGRANTTKRSASAMETTRRTANSSSHPTDSARRIPGVHNPQRRSESGDMRNRRDLSAPIRMTHRR